MNRSKPATESKPKGSIHAVFDYTELLCKATKAHERNPCRSSSKSPSFPNEPDVEIEYSGGVGQGSNNFSFYRYSVLVNLAIKLLAEQDRIAVRAMGACLLVLSCVKPKSHAVEKVKPSPVDHCSRLGLLLTSKKDRGAEDVLEAIDKAAIVRAVFGKAKEIKHLSRGVKMNLPGFLPDGERSNPDGDQAVLAEGQTEIGMADDLKEEVAVAASMRTLVLRRPT